MAKLEGQHQPDDESQHLLAVSMFRRMPLYKAMSQEQRNALEALLNKPDFLDSLSAAAKEGDGDMIDVATTMLGDAAGKLTDISPVADLMAVVNDAEDLIGNSPDEEVRNEGASLQLEALLKVADRIKTVKPIRNTGERIRGNAPCPCGCGKKFKNCPNRE